MKAHKIYFVWVKNMQYYDAKIIRDRILELVEATDVSDREVSLGIGMNPNYINQLRRSKNPGYPKMQTFLDRCDYFRITPADFFFPTIDNPDIIAKVYKELSRIGTKETLDKLVKILAGMDAEKLYGIVKIFDAYRET